MAQNEMKAMRDMPLRVRSTDGLGAGQVSMNFLCSVLDVPERFVTGTNESEPCQKAERKAIR